MDYQHCRSDQTIKVDVKTKLKFRIIVLYLVKLCSL